MRHVSQDEVFGDRSDVVCPAVEILPLPVPQFVLLRPGTLCTIIVDARSVGSGLFTLETPFTASFEELIERASLFLGNVFETAQRQEGMQCFFNEVPWALPLKRQLANGDVFSCRPALEGPGLPLLGPGGNRHTLQRRCEAPYFEVLRAVELGSQTLTLSSGTVCWKMSLLNLSTGDINSGLCRKDSVCSCVRSNLPPPRDVVSLLSCSFAKPRMGPFQLFVMGEMSAGTFGSLRLMRRSPLVLWQNLVVCLFWMACLVLHLLSSIQGRWLLSDLRILKADPT